MGERCERRPLLPPSPAHGGIRQALVGGEGRPELALEPLEGAGDAPLTLAGPVLTDVRHPLLFGKQSYRQQHDGRGHDPCAKAGARGAEERDDAEPAGRHDPHEARLTEPLCRRHGSQQGNAERTLVKPGRLGHHRSQVTHYILLPAMNLRLLFILLTTAPAPAIAQVADEGTLIIRSGGRDIGTERFRVSTGDAGLRITSRASFPGTRPPTELSASVDRTGESGGLAFQLDRRGGGGASQIYAVQKRNRLTIRRIARGGEQASETAGDESLVLLADSVFALYLQLVPLATEAGRTLTVVVPQDVRRLAVTAQRQRASQAGGTILRLSGGIEGEVALGNRGELLRISLPALGLEAVRKRD